MPNAEISVDLEILLQEKEWEICRRDPYYFLIHYCYTLDEHSGDPIRLFPDKEYLEVVVRIWLEEREVLIPKSRKMMMSWVMVALHLWICLFREGSFVAIQSKVGIDADKLVGRARFILEHMPDWMAGPEGRIQWKYKTSLRHSITFSNYSTLEAFSQDPDSIAPYTCTAVLFDEMALAPKAKESFTVIKPSVTGGGRFTGISSTRKNSYFHKLYEDRDTDEEGDRPRRVKLRDGLYYHRNKRNGFFVLFVYYYADQDKNPQTEKGKAWKKEASRNYDKSQWEREYEINPMAEGGIPAFTNFLPSIHVREDIWYNPGRQLYVSFDFGYLRPACVLAQKDAQQRLILLRHLTATNVSTPTFVAQVKQFLVSHYGIQTQMEEDDHEWFPEEVMTFCDIAGSYRSSRAEMTDVSVLRLNGFRPVFRRILRKPGLEMVRMLLEFRQDGTPGLYVSPDCQDIIDALSGDWKINPQNEQPERDGYYEHPMDCLRYIVYQLYTPGLIEALKKKPDDSEMWESTPLYNRTPRDYWNKKKRGEYDG